MSKKSREIKLSSKDYFCVFVRDGKHEMMMNFFDDYDVAVAYGNGFLKFKTGLTVMVRQLSADEFISYLKNGR